MALFFRNRPDEHCDPTEQLVAERLSRLGDDWRICWGFYYSDIKREGDFIILGPKGQMLVMEVKGGQNRQFILTGHWEDSHDGDNPLEQLRAEWRDVLDRVTEASDSGVPWVGHALCMPHLNLTGINRLHQQFGNALVLAGADLENFETWWRTHVESHANQCQNPTSVFQKAIVPQQKPAALGLFIKETDRLFHRFKQTESEFLDMLSANRQWFVEGGPGTGKTFLALQRAQQLAQAGSGQRVLFLCYNLILADQLTDIVTKLKLSRGEIVVKSWESLVDDFLRQEGLTLEIPDDREDRYRYFNEDVPGFVCTILEENPPSPEFDALVIDEAQDHDTAFARSDLESPLGWWSWYFAVLKEGKKAPIAIFLDQAQRPAFRSPENFSLDQLRQALPGTTHVRLKRVLRYTRQVHAYLAGLPFPIARDFAGLSLPGAALPEGPQVVERKTEADQLPSAIESIIAEWTGKQLCRPDDIVIMGFRRELATSSIKDCPTLAGYPIGDYQIEAPRGQLRYIGIHRAKGLDFLAVILIDLPSPDELAEAEDTDRQETFFYGATRARQLLSIIYNERETV